MLTALFNFAMKVIQFVVEGQPVPKGRPRFSQKTGRAYTPARTHDAERAVVQAYKKAYPDGEHFEAGIPLELSCRFYFKLPKKPSKSQYEGGFTQKTPDLDNALKMISDAMNNIAYADDKQICVLRAEKRYSKYPHTEIIIRDITE